MNKAFNNIKPEIRKQIINVAIEEFASWPYEKASTNSIVKKAGISKGSLFHYFNSKKELYEFLVKFVFTTLNENIAEKINWDETDVFERIMQIAIMKINTQNEYPHMLNFIKNLWLNEKAYDIDGIMSLYRKYGFEMEQLYNDVYTKNIDYSKFTNPEKIPEIIKIVQWTFEKYSEEKIIKIRHDESFDFEKIINDMENYMVIFKCAFYK